jgi:hypothetical protein
MSEGLGPVSAGKLSAGQLILDEVREKEGTHEHEGGWWAMQCTGGERGKLLSRVPTFPDQPRARTGAGSHSIEGFRQCRFFAYGGPLEPDYDERGAGKNG